MIPSHELSRLPRQLQQQVGTTTLQCLQCLRRACSVCAVHLPWAYFLLWTSFPGHVLLDQVGQRCTRVREVLDVPVVGAAGPNETSYVVNTLLGIVRVNLGVQQRLCLRSCRGHFRNNSTSKWDGQFIFILFTIFFTLHPSTVCSMVVPQSGVAGRRSQHWQSLLWRDLWLGSQPRPWWRLGQLACAPPCDAGMSRLCGKARCQGPGALTVEHVHGGAKHRHGTPSRGTTFVPQTPQAGKTSLKPQKH